MRAILILVMAALGVAFAAFAQESADDERSLFLSWVENRLSTDNRRISISGISGVLSSNATIDQITISDREGVWLTLSGARIVWTRSALLTGRLVVDELAAESITMTRRPVPARGLPAPETTPFSVPDLPISVRIGSLTVRAVEFAEPVFGEAAELSVDGRLLLEEGSLDTALQINRLDGPGGHLDLVATYSGATRDLAIDVTASEPENGVIANLLNVEGRPPLELAVKGEGPLDGFAADLTLDADRRRVLAGAFELMGRAEALGFRADLNGRVAALVPAAFRGFFGEENRLQLAGNAPAGGGFSVDNLSVTGGALALTASARVLPDGFLRELVLDASVASSDGSPVVLPVAGGDTALGHGELHVAYGRETSGRWSGSFAARDFTTADYRAAVLRLDLGGTARNLDDPSSRVVTARAEGQAEGVDADNPDIAQALGERIAIALESRFEAGQPWRVETFRLAGAALEITAAGAVEDAVFNGDVSLETASLAPFSGLAGRPLSGSANIRGEGSIGFIEGGFDLVLDGRAVGITTGDPQTDRLFEGTTEVSGRLARDASGVRAERFRLGNPQAELTADGSFSTERADFRVDARIADLAFLDERMSGQLSAKGTLDGENGIIAARFDLLVPSGSILERSLRDATLRLDGTFNEAGFAGLLDGSLFLEGDRATLSAKVGYDDRTLALTGLAMQARGAALSGEIVRDADGLLDGELQLDAPDVSMVAALLLREASGAASAEITFASHQERQNATIDASLKGLRLSEPELSIVHLDLDADVADLFGVPAANASFSAMEVMLAGVSVTSAEGSARTEENGTAFAVDALLGTGTRAALAGSLEPVGDGYRLTLDRADVSSGNRGFTLREPASLTVARERIDLEHARFAVGDGSIDASGVIADELNIDLLLNRVPLDLVNLVRPDFAAAGTFGGIVTVSGTREKPEADLVLRGQAITLSAFRSAGIAPVSVDLSGRTAGDRLALDMSVTNAQGMDAQATGTIRLDQGALDLDVRLSSFPLAAVNATAPRAGLGGRVEGTAAVGGTIGAPEISFAMEGSGVTAAALSRYGISTLSVAARGSYSGGQVRLQQASGSGTDGLTVTADGVVPLFGSGLSVAFSGSAPLTLANRFLAERGAVATGSIRFSGQATGAVSDPRFFAALSASGAGFVDPVSDTRLQAIALNATVDGNDVRIGTLTARLATGGSLSATGTVSLVANFPADIAVTLDNARYSDGEVAAATVSGRLAVTGSLLRDPLIAGDILVHRAELTVPERLEAAEDVAVVDHVNAPADVRRTIVKALPEGDGSVPRARPSVPQLDIRVNAPSRVFLRGRGLDVELGGSMQVQGPVINVRPAGGFGIIRGRLSILGQRIALDSGRVSLIGDLDPFVDLTATTTGNDLVVTIRATGRVSDLDISFSSQPELPEDEILSRLLFGQGISSLSPLQLARLAAAAAELAGGGPSILEGVREATGLDDLEIVADEEGNTTARAGRYIADNVYLGVEAGSKGKTKVTIDLDITDDVKARGALSEEDTSIGIFFEKDY